MYFVHLSSMIECRLNVCGDKEWNRGIYAKFNLQHIDGY